MLWSRENPFHNTHSVAIVAVVIAAASPATAETVAALIQRLTLSLRSISPCVVSCTVVVSALTVLDRPDRRAMPAEASLPFLLEGEQNKSHVTSNHNPWQINNNKPKNKKSFVLEGRDSVYSLLPIGEDDEA